MCFTTTDKQTFVTAFDAIDTMSCRWHSLSPRSLSLIVNINSVQYKGLMDSNKSGLVPPCCPLLSIVTLSSVVTAIVDTAKEGPIIRFLASLSHSSSIGFSRLRISQIDRHLNWCILSRIEIELSWSELNWAGWLPIEITANIPRLIKPFNRFKGVFTFRKVTHSKNHSTDWSSFVRCWTTPEIEQFSLSKVIQYDKWIGERKIDSIRRLIRI